MPQKLWARLIKGPELRFISHLDLLRTVEKALRRAQIPIALTQGYNPHPKLAFAAALPVGMSSSGEYVEFTLKERWEPERFRAALNAQLPEGLKIAEVKEVLYKVPSLMALVNLAGYEVLVQYPPKVSPEEFAAVWENFLAQEAVVIERLTKKGTRTFDILPLIYSYQVQQAAAATARIILQLRMGPRGSVRPEEVLQAFWRYSGWEGRISTIHRQGLYIVEDGQVYLPLKWVFKK